MCLSNAFELSTDDIIHVAEAHGVELSEEEAQGVLDDLDTDAIVRGLLYYTDMDDQITSAYEDIEKHLLQEGVVEGERVYHSP